MNAGDFVRTQNYLLLIIDSENLTGSSEGKFDCMIIEDRTQKSPRNRIGETARYSPGSGDELQACPRCLKEKLMVALSNTENPVARMIFIGYLDKLSKDNS